MKLGFIGVGKMGSALLEGVLRSGVATPDEVRVHDVYQPAVKGCVESHGVKEGKSNLGVFQDSEATVLCVKPHDARSTLADLKVASAEGLVISIAAGVKLADLEAAVDGRHRVIRVMPNTPALVGKGASAYALGDKASPEDAALVEKILESVGIAFQVKESQLDAVTGLSGSGPAYIYTVIEALADGGVLEGLPKAMALQLAAQTVLGAAEMVIECDEHPAELRDNVISPGGTTVAAMAELEAAGLRSALIEAVRTASQKSRELG